MRRVCFKYSLCLTMPRNDDLGQTIAGIRLALQESGWEQGREREQERERRPQLLPVVRPHSPVLRSNVVPTSPKAVPSSGVVQPTQVQERLSLSLELVCLVCWKFLFICSKFVVSCILHVFIHLTDLNSLNLAQPKISGLQLFDAFIICDFPVLTDMRNEPSIFLFLADGHAR